MDNSEWWNQLNGNKWKDIFKKAINIYTEPSESELDKMVHLQTLSCHACKIKSLEPLRQLTNLNRFVKCLAKDFVVFSGKESKIYLGRMPR